ncbi:DNA-directed RNA polymerase II subunit RPB1-like [Colletes gigas]|uniref:DNA-directed RNA polymerase II subunit RPB1-like n=1 Tax=Colletes gigas TaxID=935657 RepID=UPI001C9AB46B|nr:DNA-directed RNA polymerase II subunit RPB1-like [Colletes gigas]
MLVLLLLSTAFAVQGYGKSNDPNDEPFLPIYPVYPYSPKLIKRGADRESSTQLSPELYAPKVDAKDSYSASFSSNYPRDPYYPNYNLYSKATTPSSYSYGSVPYAYPTTAYPTAPYPTSAYSDYNSYSSPYAMAPPSYSAVPYSASYPNYYYQPPYYYPNYYTQPLYPPPPMPPPTGDYSNDPYSEPNDKNGRKKSNGEKRYRGNDADQDTVGNQYVDGGNYISGNGKDLDGQSSTYKSSSPRNQLEQLSDLRVKNLQIPVPTTSYRVISVAGQPVGPDYPLPAPYLKAQQLEELMSQTWAKMMAQNLQQQSALLRANEANKDSQTGSNQYANQNDRSIDGQRYVSVPNVIAKTGLAYIVNPNILGKLNVGQNHPVQTSMNQLKGIKYPLTPGVYTAVEKTKEQTDSGEYDTYENPSSQGTQDYDSSLSQTDKQPQNYENDSGQYYQSPNNFVTAQPPRAYSYQYSGYNPSQTSTQQQQTQQYKNNLEDVNFGAKTKKG